MNWTQDKTCGFALQEASRGPTQDSQLSLTGYCWDSTEGNATRRLVLKGKGPLLRTPREWLHRKLLLRRELSAGLSLGHLRGAYYRPANGLMVEVPTKGVFRLHAREQVILKGQVERRRSPPSRRTRPVVLDKCQLCPRVAVTNAARHGPVKVLLT